MLRDLKAFALLAELLLAELYKSSPATAPILTAVQADPAGLFTAQVLISVPFLTAS